MYMYVQGVESAVYNTMLPCIRAVYTHFKQYHKSFSRIVRTNSVHTVVDLMKIN